MLVGVLLAVNAVAIPPEHTGAGVGVVANHAVHSGKVQVLLYGVEFRAAAGVDKQRIVAQSQFQKIQAGRPDGGDRAHLRGGLIKGQHTGNAAFSQHFVDDIRLRDALLGQSLLQVVDDNCHRLLA